MIELSLAQKILGWIIPVMFAIILHEVAHGWIANKLGDSTAKLAGRLTLNPISHIDLIGTIIIPAILYSMGGFIFGWAKPVPVDYRNLRNLKRDSALVALAGPMANLLMALFWAGVIKFSIHSGLVNNLNSAVLFYMGKIGLIINLVLMVINLIPIPPLDGSRIVSSFLSPSASIHYNKLEPYGFLILLALLATGTLSHITQPLIAGLLGLIKILFNF